MADTVELGANIFNPAESVSCKMEMSCKRLARGLPSGKHSIVTFFFSPAILDSFALFCTPLSEMFGVWVGVCLEVLVGGGGADP